LSDLGIPLTLELYRKLYTVRRAEEVLIQHYPDDEMKTPMHMSMGQEAVAVGVCQALDLNDQIWSSYRTHAAFLAKTGDSDMFFGELYGKVTGTASGKAGSMHLADPEKGFVAASAIVGSAIPPAVGMAFANKTKRNGMVSSVFFGDGAMDEGAFWESLNVACVMHLPVLMICEDNGLAVHTPTQMRRAYASVSETVESFGLPVFYDDSNDVEQIYSVAKEAVAFIRTQGAPAFLHIKCYRYLEHVGIAQDFDAGYRPISEYNDWLAKDSLGIQRARLRAGGMSEHDVAHAESIIDDQIQRSVQRAMQAPFAALDELHKGVFREAD
jgi:TPP-dependent pyruvate/acetoin dehydrogenase alpha subunit